jgi:hypothetical protein
LRRGRSRIGALMDPEGQRYIKAFLQGLQDLGWAPGRNVQIEYRLGGSDPDRIQTYATELVGFETGRYPCTDGAGFGPTSAGNPHDTHRVHVGHRSGGERVCCKPFPPRWHCAATNGSPGALRSASRSQSRRCRRVRISPRFCDNAMRCEMLCWRVAGEPDLGELIKPASNGL